MPGTLVKAHKLLYLAVAVDQYMWRHFEACEIGKTRVLGTIQLTCEQSLGRIRAILTFGQRNAVHYDKFWQQTMGPQVTVGARPPHGLI